MTANAFAWCSPSTAANPSFRQLGELIEEGTPARDLSRGRAAAAMTGVSVSLDVQRSHDRLPQLPFLVTRERLVREKAANVIAEVRPEVPPSRIVTERGAQPLKGIRTLNFRAGKPARSLGQIHQAVVR